MGVAGTSISTRNIYIYIYSMAFILKEIVVEAVDRSQSIKCVNILIEFVFKKLDVLENCYQK